MASDSAAMAVPAIDPPPVQMGMKDRRAASLLHSGGGQIDYRRLFEQYIAGDKRAVLVLNGAREIVAMNASSRELLAYAGDVPVALGEVIRDVKVSFAVGDAIHDRKVVTHETFLPDPELVLDVTIVPTIARDGGVDHLVMTVEDSTRLRHLETVRKDFVANVSHELRTPIASINLLVETLQRLEFADQPDAAHFLRRIQVETESMGHLVEELLQLSRLESGRLSLKMESVGVGDLIDEVEARLAVMANERGIELSTDVQEALPPVLVDGMAVRQILMNLTHNAIKFTPRGGSITLRARLSHPGVEVEVADTGVGMDAAEAARVFERFYKVDKSRSRDESGGTGLGLAIAKHLLELHHSRLQVVSEPGRGSRFTFRLPPAE